jgi:hypothetical protein
MLELHDVSSADTASVPSDSTIREKPNSNNLEIKVEPADAIPRSAPPKDTEKASTRKVSPFFRHLLRYGARTAAITCLLVLAWAGGAYYSLGPLPLDLMKPSRASEVPQSSERDEMVRAVRQMTEEISALKTRVRGMAVTQNAGMEKANNGESLKNKLDSMQTTIADLARRVDKLESESTAKLSQINEQLTSIEQKIAASRVALASRNRPPRKHAKHLHDAFDPTRDPAAPGAPRPLGAR